MEDYKEFLDKYSSVLHRNHYHMLTAKHSLMQMYGRTEGYLIQDMTDDQVTKIIIFNVKRAHSSMIVPFVENIPYHTVTYLQLKEKETLCREMIELCTKLDPCKVRLQIYLGVSLYELHLPLLQYGKRKWETGQLPTDEFRCVN